MSWGVQLAPILIAGAALVVSTLLASRSLSRSASAEYVAQLETRVAACEKDRTELRHEIGFLRRELSLLRENEHRLLTKLVEGKGEP